MTKPIQIRNDDAVREVREAAALTGLSITRVVAEGARLVAERARRTRSPEERRREVDRLIAEFRALPKTGQTLTDDDLYDEYGLPK
ncbi:MAG: type II toxin-antitoxin system VapB family antitoxin [Phenylobacterium sp.]|uniref:type II toxin-antitoxin system VapB family antitoxin n=1 Tax=Phenylobacterium sp. TaxID=1871053 RepID=UPI001A45443C|nr:type II toxin-antitoxin system VapB family antitoxin [Phenylobacterium sp.]MBL8555296.1 type II toxin-antitoxin system VapB family antitoxin [Phenylobacterium sp.]